MEREPRYPPISLAGFLVTLYGRIGVTPEVYVDLPDTPLRASVPDQRQARMWFERAIPLEVVETALLLACLRRTVRPTNVPPLPRVRSLAYFQPVVEELREHPALAGYLQYLRSSYAVSSITPARPAGGGRSSS